MDFDKNCGVCVHSSDADGSFCHHPGVGFDMHDRDVPVGVARGASGSPCGPDGKLHEPCQCLAPFCDRHGKDRRR